MLSNTDLLRRFLDIVDHGTLHAAAEAIGLTQPALTRSIRMLEAEMGAPIFERQGRRLALTPLGEMLEQHARHLLREQRQMEKELHLFKRGEIGSLRIGAAYVWMTELLPKIVAKVHANYPDIRIHLQSMNYEDGIASLKAGTLDVFFGGFQRMDSLPSFLVRAPFFTARLVVIAQNDHPIHTHEVATSEELLKYGWLSFQSNIAYLDVIGDIVSAAGDGPPNVVVQCDSMTSALELLRNGNYLAYLPSSFISQQGGRGLSVVKTEIAEAQFQSGPIYRRTLQKSAAFEMLYALAREETMRAQLPVAT